MTCTQKASVEGLPHAAMLKGLIGNTLRVNAAKKPYEPEEKPRRTKVRLILASREPTNLGRTF